MSYLVEAARMLSKTMNDGNGSGGVFRAEPSVVKSNVVDG